MSAAPLFPLDSAGEHAPRVIVGRREVACDWCSCDATPYTRIVPGSVHRSEDTIHLCDECAGELAAAVKRKLRMGRERRRRGERGGSAK